MKYKQVLLTGLSVVLLLIFYNVGIYHKWVRNDIYEAFASFDEETDFMGTNERMTIRHRNSYPFLMDIKNILDKTGKKNPVLLLPPNDYVKAMTHNKANVFSVPEPIVCYYLSGIKAVWPNSSNVKDANFAVLIRENKLQVVEITDTNVLNEALALYKKYTPGL